MSGSDAIVVGSGAAGGWAAKELTEAGMQVLLLEAGPRPQPPAPAGRAGVTRLWRHVRRTQAVQELHPIYWEKDPDLFVRDTAQPYETAEGRPFVWIRGRQLGGRSLLWGGVTLRLSDFELQAAGRDGYGPVWPIRYADLAPYYDRVERFLGIHGTREGLPQLPDGCFIGARPLTGAERQVADGVADDWPDRRLIPSRGLAVLQQGHVHTRLTSVGSTIAAARATGRLRIRTGAAVSHLLPARGAPGAGGVAFVDAASGKVSEARTRLIVLCASTIDTVRILLTTREEHPELPVDESASLGRYLMDHVLAGTIVEVDGIPYQEPAPRTGADSFLIPRFQNIDAAAPDSETVPHLRGYGLWGGIQRRGFAGRRGGAARGFVVAHGEMLARAENRVELDAARNADGLRRVSIDCAWGENDQAMHAAMRRAIEEVMQAGRGRTRTLFGATAGLPGMLGLPGRLERLWSAAPPGAYAHEVGGARMGGDPSDSVVDARNRCWALPNVLVTDGACWPTSGWQGPTLTIMAVTARACALAVADLRRGELSAARTGRRHPGRRSG